MSEWSDSQNKLSSNFRKLLQERIEKAHLRHKLTSEEAKCLARLESIADKLKRGESVQNRQLQTWLSKDNTNSLSMSGKNSLNYEVSSKINQAA